MVLNNINKLEKRNCYYIATKPENIDLGNGPLQIEPDVFFRRFRIIKE